MRKKVLLFACFLAALSGCAVREAPVFETVQDTLCARTFARAPYRISFSVPEDAEAQADGAADGWYVQSQGDYEIRTQIVRGNGIDEVVYAVSGFSQPGIQIIETNCNETIAYQFAWAYEDENGIRISRAAAYKIGDCYYTLSFSLREGLSAKYRDCINMVFDSFALEKISD